MSRTIHREDLPSPRKRRKKGIEDSGYAELMDDYDPTLDMKEHLHTPEAPDGPLLLSDVRYYILIIFVLLIYNAG